MFFGMKKDKVIPIRVNHAQHASFATKAKSFNMDVSEWLRALGENSRPNELPIGVPCSNPKTPEVVKAPKVKAPKVSVNDGINAIVGATPMVQARRIPLNQRPIRPVPKQGK